MVGGCGDDDDYDDDDALCSSHQLNRCGPNVDDRQRKKEAKVQVDIRF